ncbi:MAG: hypothetical protein WD069_18910 [Planctomycetales bacterium]
MTRQIALLLGLVAACWLAYMAWLTGYQAGYEEATVRAWEQIETAAPARRQSAAGERIVPARTEVSVLEAR